MSAFVVNKAHITAMLKAGMAHPRFRLSWYIGGEQGMRELDFGNADAVGQMLLDECVASVHDHYGGDRTDLPGPINAEWLTPYRYPLNAMRTPTPVEALKLISCYEYQSCEHPEWEQSEAKVFCNALRHAMIAALPGYDEAPWEWR